MDLYSAFLLCCNEMLCSIFIFMLGTNLIAHLFLYNLLHMEMRQFPPLLWYKCKINILFVNYNSSIFCYLFRSCFRIYMYVGDTSVLLSYIWKEIYVYCGYLCTGDMHTKVHFKTASNVSFVNILYYPILFYLLWICHVGYVNFLFWPVLPFHVLFYCVLYLPDMPFHVAYHINLLCSFNSIAPWIVPYRFILNFLVPSHSVLSRCDTLRSFSSRPDS